MSPCITRLSSWGSSRAPESGKPRPPVSRVIGRMMGKEGREESHLALHPPSSLVYWRVEKRTTVLSGLIRTWSSQGEMMCPTWTLQYMSNESP